MAIPVTPDSLNVNIVQGFIWESVLVSDDPADFEAIDIYLSASFNIYRKEYCSSF